MVRFWISDFWISKDLAKLLHFVLFDFVRSSLLWELPDKGILGYLQFWVGSLEAVEHGTWTVHIKLSKCGFHSLNQLLKVTMDNTIL